MVVCPGATSFAQALEWTAEVYRHAGLDVCADCLDLSMGLLEREEVDKFLASW